MTTSTHGPSTDLEDERIPIVEERLEIGKKLTETGRLRLTSSVASEEAVVDETLVRVDVRVERVPVDLLVEDVPLVRAEAGRTIVPVFEEVLVRRYRITEEVHLISEQNEEPVKEQVMLRRTHVEVERFQHPEQPESA